LIKEVSKENQGCLKNHILIKLIHKFGRAISEISSELPGLSNGFTSTDVILHEAGAHCLLKQRFIFYLVQHIPYSEYAFGYIAVPTRNVVSND
jgi:hypothetical protein